MLKKSLKYTFLLLLLLLQFSCKKVAKSTLNKSSKAVVENSKSAIKKQLNKKSDGLTTTKAAKSPERTTVKTGALVKTIEWDDLSIIFKNNNDLLQHLNKYSAQSRSEILRLINSDKRFFNSLKSSKNIVKDFEGIINDAPVLADNWSFFHAFVRSRSSYSISYRLHQNIILKTEGNVVKFFNKIDNKLIGSLENNVFTFNSSFKEVNKFLESNLIPNTAYKSIGKKNSVISYQTDEFGRIFSINGQNISVDEISSIIKARIGESSEFSKAFKNLQQKSNNREFDFDILLKHTDDALVHNSSSIRLGKNGISNIEETFVNKAKIGYSTKEITEFIKKQSPNFKELTPNKQNQLINNMVDDPILAKYMNQDFEYNLKRWLNSRNSVDVTKIIRTAKGNMPINARTYAGNNYDSNPHFNPRLMARVQAGNGKVHLKFQGTLNYEELITLSNKPSNNIFFSKAGYPDFTPVSYKVDGKPVAFDIKELTGNRNKDMFTASDMFREKYGIDVPKGYTWHHKENSSILQLVDSRIHQLIDHSGGISTF